MADAPATSEEPRRLEISKYPNRRYYDKTRGRHLTIDELLASIREGYEIKVTDSKTGEDITPQVLAQIILERDAPKLSAFPVELLHRLLRSNQQLVLDFTQKYFSGALNAFLDSQKKTEEYLRQAMGLPGSANQPPPWARMMWGPFNPGAWPGAAPTEPASAQPPPAELASQLQILQSQLNDLQSKLADANARRTGKKRKSGKK